MENLRSRLIPGAPLREPDYFDGPLSWWNNGLSCGGIERQIVAAAQYFHAKENPVRLLCFTIESRMAIISDYLMTDVDLQ